MTADESLRERTWRLLQPGEIALDGLIVQTDLDGSQDGAMHEATLAVGDLIAERAGHEPRDTFVYSGTDDPSFASNQHQGQTIDDESFVWECQQLLRDGAFALVFYFERGPSLSGLVEDCRELGFDATPVPGADPPGD